MAPPGKALRQRALRCAREKSSCGAVDQASSFGAPERLRLPRLKGACAQLDSPPRPACYAGGSMQDGPTSDVARVGLVVAGKFRLDAVIGQGGMGSVWSATHLGLGHRIAIKLVSREFVKSAEALRRFDAEAKAAARLQSRHVVQVYDSGSLDDATPYIAMELLTGENLQQRIE